MKHKVLTTALTAALDKAKAIDYFEQALASDLKTFGEDHPTVQSVAKTWAVPGFCLASMRRRLEGAVDNALATKTKLYRLQIFLRS